MCLFKLTSGGGPRKGESSEGHIAGREEAEPSPAVTLATSPVMVSTASNVYVALEEKQFHSRQLNRATGDEHMKSGQQGAVAVSLRASGLRGPPSRHLGLISAKYVTRQAGECLSG